jgi:transportin-3
MAANGQHVFDPVLAAHNTMASQADRAQKEQAHQYLEQFQKSVCRLRSVISRTEADWQ